MASTAIRTGSGAGGDSGVGSASGRVGDKSRLIRFSRPRRIRRLGTATGNTAGFAVIVSELVREPILTPFFDARSDIMPP